MSFVKRFQTSLVSLYNLPENASYVVAYSGGVDSHVLLHCCKKLNSPVRAVHVHHGLQTIADEWVSHCQNICKTLNIHLDVVYVDAKKNKGQSPEEAARYARYQALQNNLTDGDCLLTAQHLNDQAETLLLQLFRTASTAGLSAMPQSRQLGEYIHLRPLLSFSREEIEDFAKDNALHWVEDPSNRDITLDRNFIRKEVVPLLEKRWTEMTKQLSTVARLQSNNLQVLEDMASIDLANSIIEAGQHTKSSIYDVVSVLSIHSLKQLSSARLFNVLRYWIIKSTKASNAKKSPTRNLLEEIDKALINSRQDANPVIVFSRFEFRKFQNGLYLLKSKVDKNNSGNDIEWKPTSALILSALNIQLKSVDSTGEGLNKSLLNESLKICFRKNGENFHPAGRQHSQCLKKLLQEANIPPWDRESIPLLYFKDELIAVVGLWVCKQYSVAADEEGWLIDVEVL